jgi:hypothetical protein
MRLQPAMLAILGASALCNYTFAQSSAATDNELYAAFCLGVLSSVSPSAAGAERRAAQISRFSGYLGATGILLDPSRDNAIGGVSAAETRGRVDEGQCTITMMACVKTIPAPRRALTPAEEEALSTRMNACAGQDTACTRAIRCLEPDALPF